MTAYTDAVTACMNETGWPGPEWGHANGALEPSGIRVSVLWRNDLNRAIELCEPLYGPDDWEAEP